jgi:hypothetical protein
MACPGKGRYGGRGGARGSREFDIRSPPLLYYTPAVWPMRAKQRCEKWAGPRSGGVRVKPERAKLAVVRVRELRDRQDPGVRVVLGPVLDLTESLIKHPVDP